MSTVAPSAMHRRKRAAMAGFLADTATAREHINDSSPAVRRSSLRALARLGDLSTEELQGALADSSATVRVTALELAVHRDDVSLARVATALSDATAPVVEAAAWACGEKASTSSEPLAAVVAELALVAGGHDDALCRESAVAALGAIGDRGGLPAILAALDDKPEVRRRAVIALAPFEGSEVETALERARSDRDRQVRAAAEELGFDRTDVTSAQLSAIRGRR